LAFTSKIFSAEVLLNSFFDVSVVCKECIGLIEYYCGCMMLVVEKDSFYPEFKELQYGSVVAY